ASSLDDLCHVGQCNAQTGECGLVNANDGTPCGDQGPDKCVVGDVCKDGVCEDGTMRKACASSLDDLCHVGQCNAQTGECGLVNASEGTACGDIDNNACTPEQCDAAGECKSGPRIQDCCTGPTDCTDDTDGNICTQPYCDLPLQPITDQLERELTNISPTDTSLISSKPGGLHRIVVTGTCRQDRPANEGKTCNDGLFCITGETCSNGVCAGDAKPYDCSDQNTDCRAYECDEAADVCAWRPINDGKVCNDGDECTSGEVCDKGFCKGGTPNPACGATPPYYYRIEDVTIPKTANDPPVTIYVPRHNDLNFFVNAIDEDAGDMLKQKMGALNDEAIRVFSSIQFSGPDAQDSHYQFIWHPQEEDWGKTYKFEVFAESDDDDQDGALDRDRHEIILILEEGPAECKDASDCDDGNACTQNLCVNDQCVFNPIQNCCLNETDCRADTDGNICTKPYCDITNHVCKQDQAANDGTACGDAANPSQCLAADICRGGTCADGGRIAGCCLADSECKDQDNCTKDTCNTATHQCVFTKDTALEGCGDEEAPPEDEPTPFFGGGGLVANIGPGLIGGYEEPLSSPAAEAAGGAGRGWPIMWYWQALYAELGKMLEGGPAFVSIGLEPESLRFASFGPQSVFEGAARSFATSFTQKQEAPKIEPIVQKEPEPVRPVEQPAVQESKQKESAWEKIKKFFGRAFANLLRK
ncbi:MAG: hypothetical protein HY582_03025, partial [Candidatus Omnitrophica bacterium]|nr:hypothetical protein [Candidatus Omnitrophota bacterium]